VGGRWLGRCLSSFCSWTSVSARPTWRRHFEHSGSKVEILLDHFESGTPDAEWLPFVGRRGWTLLSKDKWSRKRKVERLALESAGVAVFVLSSGDMKGVEMADAFCKAYPRMKKIVRDHLPPFVAVVRGNGQVSLLTDPPRRGGLRR